MVSTTSMDTHCILKCTLYFQLYLCRNAKHFEPLNLGRLQYLIERGRLDVSRPITMYHINKAGGLGNVKQGVKLLGNVSTRTLKLLQMTYKLLQGAEWFNCKIDIEVSRASQTAIEAIERQGGKVVTAYYNKLSLQALLHPEKYNERLKPRKALPQKSEMPYYLNEKNRGYLLTEEGQRRLSEAGLAGCYVDENGRVAVPGKPTVEGDPPAPTKEEYLKVMFCIIET